MIDLLGGAVASRVLEASSSGVSLASKLDSIASESARGRRQLLFLATWIPPGSDGASAPHAYVSWPLYSLLWLFDVACNRCIPDARNERAYKIKIL